MQEHHAEKGDFTHKLENAIPGYGMERNSDVAKEIIADHAGDDAPWVHHTMSWKLFASLTAMSFLWVGSQIPLYLLGGVFPLMYNDIGGYDRYIWLIVGYLIPNAALCPFVGALSDLIGRKVVAAIGQVLLVIGPLVTVTANNMNVAIGGMVIAGLGAGLNELIALAGTAELVPVKKRGLYVGMVVFTILPFCPSVLWAQLIAHASNWRYVGIPICVWNFIGLVMVIVFYDDPAKHKQIDKKQVLKEVDYIGGALSIAGCTLFMMGLQWGAVQYEWAGSAHVLVPFVLGFALIIAFFVYEAKFAKYPMVPPKMFSVDKRSMICLLLVTFFSGGNFFVLLLFWPTEIYNVYGDDYLQVGIRSLPIGFGIIGGAVLALVSIPIIKGRTKLLMIFATGLMTAATGLLSLARKDNLNAVYAIVTLASIGVGMVIVPASIIAQVICPPELIGTITAITLAIRYLGGAIGFSAYYNIFFPKLSDYLREESAINLVVQGVSLDPNALTTLLTLGAQAKYPALREFIKTGYGVIDRSDECFDKVISAVQDGMVEAYKWPYWMSIAFGGICFIASFGIKDIRHYL